MSSRTQFEYIMVHLAVGTNRKYRRLKPAERWAAVAGVWCIAGESPVRGALLIAEGVEANERDVANTADVPLIVARGAIQALKDLGELVYDNDVQAWVITDWDKHQPRAKASDTREAWRERKARERARKANGHADVTRDIRDIPRDVTRDTPPAEPPPAKQVTADLQVARERLQSGNVQTVFDAWLASKTLHSGRQATAKLDDKRRRLILRALKDFPLDDILAAVQGWLQSPHHRGENDQGTVYNDLGLLLRDAAHIERFRDLHRSATNGRATAAERERKLIGPQA